MGEKSHFFSMAFLQAKRAVAALRVRYRMLFVQRSFLARMTPKFGVVLGELDLDLKLPCKKN